MREDIDELANVGRDVRVKIRGAETIVRVKCLTFRQVGELQRLLRRLAPHPVDDARTRVDGMPERDRAAVLAAAVAEGAKSWPPRLESPEGLAALQSPEGLDALVSMVVVGDEDFRRRVAEGVSFDTGARIFAAAWGADDPDDPENAPKKP